MAPYPDEYDEFANPAEKTPLKQEVGGRTHAEMHADLNDALEHTQHALGLNPEGDADTVAERLDLIEEHPDDTEAHPASNIVFEPDGTLASTNVQDALIEIRDEAAAISEPIATELVLSQTVDWIVVATQAAYDALPTPDPLTLYIIRN